MQRTNSFAKRSSSKGEKSYDDFYLGLKLVIRPREHLSSPEISMEPICPFRSLRQGLLTKLLNPTTGVFYVTFLPQFVADEASVDFSSFGLAAVHIVLTLIWFAVLMAATVPKGRWIRRPDVVRMKDRLAGGVIVAFAARRAFPR